LGTVVQSPQPLGGVIFTRRHRVDLHLDLALVDRDPQPYGDRVEEQLGPNLTLGARLQLRPDLREGALAIGPLRPADVERCDERRRATFDERGRHVEGVTGYQLVEESLWHRVVLPL